MPNLVSNDPCDCRKYHDSGELAVTFPDFKRWQGTDSEASSMEACGPGSTWTTRAAASVGDRTLSDSSESGTQRAAATCNSPNSQRTEVDGERKAISSTAWHRGSELIEIKSWEFEDLNCKHLCCILLNDDLSSIICFRNQFQNCLVFFWSSISKGHHHRMTSCFWVVLKWNVKALLQNTSNPHKPGLWPNQFMPWFVLQGLANRQMVTLSPRATPLYKQCLSVGP